MAAGSETPNDRTILSLIRDASGAARENLAWLRAQMPAIFFVTLREEPEKIATLCLGLRRLTENRYLFLSDKPGETMVARLNVPGSIHTNSIVAPLGSPKVRVSTVV